MRGLWLMAGTCWVLGAALNVVSWRIARHAHRSCEAGHHAYGRAIATQQETHDEGAALGHATVATTLYASGFADYAVARRISRGACALMVAAACCEIIVIVGGG